MDESASRERTPTPRLLDRGAPIIDVARRYGTQARRLAVRGLRSLVHTWRSSLQFRVVSTTMVLGLVVIVLLGSYLYQAISSGLEQDRITSASIEASGLASEAQQAFDATDSTESAAQLGLFARDLVQQKLASPGSDRSRRSSSPGHGATTGPSSSPRCFLASRGSRRSPTTCARRSARTPADSRSNSSASATPRPTRPCRLCSWARRSSSRWQAPTTSTSSFPCSASSRRSSSSPARSPSGEWRWSCSSVRSRGS